MNDIRNVLKITVSSLASAAMLSACAERMGSFESQKHTNNQRLEYCKRQANANNPNCVSFMKRMQARGGLPVDSTKVDPAKTGEQPDSGATPAPARPGSTAASPTPVRVQPTHSDSSVEPTTKPGAIAVSQTLTEDGRQIPKVVKDARDLLKAGDDPRATATVPAMLATGGVDQGRAVLDGLELNAIVPRLGDKALLISMDEEMVTLEFEKPRALKVSAKKLDTKSGKVDQPDATKAFQQGEVNVIAFCDEEKDKSCRAAIVFVQIMVDAAASSDNRAGTIKAARRYVIGTDGLVLEKSNNGRNEKVEFDGKIEAPAAAGPDGETGPRGDADRREDPKKKIEEKITADSEEFTRQGTAFNEAMTKIIDTRRDISAKITAIPASGEASARLAKISESSTAIDALEQELKSFTGRIEALRQLNASIANGFTSLGRADDGAAGRKDYLKKAEASLKSESSYVETLRKQLDTKKAAAAAEPARTATGAPVVSDAPGDDQIKRTLKDFESGAAQAEQKRKAVYDFYTKVASQLQSESGDMQTVSAKDLAALKGEALMVEKSVKELKDITARASQQAQAVKPKLASAGKTQEVSKIESALAQMVSAVNQSEQDLKGAQDLLQAAKVEASRATPPAADPDAYTGQESGD